MSANAKLYLGLGVLGERSSPTYKATTTDTLLVPAH